MERKTRVRFAPSPTGPLHMGGVRTALYNYLYAKQRGGDFIIRIEDTDSHRFVPGAEQYIIEALRWCGIIPDEGVDENGKVVEVPSERHPHAPYRQSQRRPIYRKYAEELVDSGWAYYAFDSSEDLEKRRSEAEASGETFIYNQKTRKELKNSLTLSPSEVKTLLEETSDWTIRFKMPENTVVKMDDLIRGHIEVNTDTLDDKVLWKRADELPTYHLANIVDDHLMEISEVIRGEEWLPSLPLHYMLYKAFGWEESMPRFAHLSLLLKPDGKGKLSKRDGDRLGFPVFPLRWVNAEGEVSRGYREDGYFYGADKHEWALSAYWGSYGAPGMYMALVYNYGKLDHTYAGRGFEASLAYTTPQTDWTFMATYGYLHNEEKKLSRNDKSVLSSKLGGEIIYNLTANFQIYTELERRYESVFVDESENAALLGLIYNF